ncbi:MAG: MBL fold metallo-hydrolase [Candidatus Eisenbacteria sp.]|nr:MBL fold metallo-hydrolase [Candidatus Eisenbacteria bacterium]
MNKEAPFEVIFLGTGTCVPSMTRGSPGLALRVCDDLVLLDGGSGTLRSLLQAGLDYRDLTHVLYTHTHPDHAADLVPLLTAMKYTPGFTRTEDLSIWGPPGFREFFEKLSDAYPVSLGAETYRLQVDEVRESTIHDQDKWHFTVRFLRHPTLNAGYRIEVPALERTLVYTGDTENCPELVELARGADLLISECSFPDGQGTKGHLTPSELAPLAEEAGVKRLLLAHIYPAGDREDIVTACRKFYSGPVEKAEDFMRVALR